MDECAEANLKLYHNIDKKSCARNVNVISVHDNILRDLLLIANGFTFATKLSWLAKDLLRQLRLQYYAFNHSGAL